MEQFLIIHPENPGAWYALFYLLAFLSGFVLLMREGSVRGYPMVSWMLVIGTAFLFFMLGCRLIVFTQKEWSALLHLEAVPYASGMSVLGGILFSIPGILLANRILQLRIDMMDSFAFVLPVAIMIQRFGCLMAGCCYGTPTDLPVFVRYGTGSPAFVSQVKEGLIQAHYTHSLSVHPVQLYEVLGGLLMILLLLQLRKVLRAPGNLFLTSLGLYAMIRFVTEFWRAGGNPVYFLDAVQCTILLFLPVLLAIIAFRERNSVSGSTVTAGDRHMMRPVLYFMGLVGAFVFVSRWLGPLQIIAFNFVLIPMLARLVWSCFERITIRGYRLASLLLPLGSLVLMSQTLSPRTSDKSAKSSYNTLSIGGMAGDTSMLYGPDYGTSCNGPVPTTDFSNDFSAFGLGFAHTTLKDDLNTTLQLNVFEGSQSEHASHNTGTYQSTHTHYSNIGISPYAQFDWTNFGLGGGLNIGNFTRIEPAQIADNTSVSEYNLFPSFHLRGGNLSKGFVEYDLSNQFPSAFPSLNHQVAVGVGISKSNRVWRGGAIRVGTGSNAGLFIKTTTCLGENMLMDLFYGGYGGIGNPYDHTHSHIISLSFRYRFSRKGVFEVR